MGEWAVVFRPLVWGYDPDDPDIHMVPEDYLMALVTAAAARLPQPVDQDDLEMIRSTLWDLLIKVTQGPMTPTYGPLQYAYDRRDMQTWRNRKSSSVAPAGAPQAPRPNCHAGTYHPTGSGTPSAQPMGGTAHFAPYMLNTSKPGGYPTSAWS